MGHDRIGFVANMDSPRFYGYRQALDDARLPFREEYVMTGRDHDAYAAQILDLDPRPTAILIANTGQLATTFAVAMRVGTFLSRFEGK